MSVYSVFNKLKKLIARKYILYLAMFCTCAYLGTFLYVVFRYHTFSPNFFENYRAGNSVKRIAMYSIKKYIGDEVLLRRMEKAADNIGYDYISGRIPYKGSKLFKRIVRHTSNFLTYIFGVEYTLANTHWVYVKPSGIKVMTINVPFNMVVNVEDRFLKQAEHLKDYDIFVDLHKFCEEEDMLSPILKKAGKKKFMVIPGYFGTNYKEFIPVQGYNKMTITGFLWGPSRDSLRFKDALKRLAADNLLEAYGPNDPMVGLNFLGKSYKGFLNYKAFENDTDSIQRKNGISLVIHSLEHANFGIPTNRIVEGITSGSVVITDYHPFIKKYFGDNVLYYNAHGTSKEIYNEIKAHYNWIRANPEKVRKMTENAHKILMENFTIEKALLEVDKAVQEFKNS